MRRPGERPVELVDLQGAWRRDGRSLAEDPWDEPTEILWLQVGRHFCDLRTPLGGREAVDLLDRPQAFSGTVEVAGGEISFHHDLDSLPRDPAHPDQGTVHRLEDVMFERGPGFEERWVVSSLPGDDVAIAELRATQEGAVLARLIRVGPLALAIWSGADPGGAQYNTRHDWTKERPLGSCDDGWLVDATAAALGVGAPLPGDWALLDPGEV
jgi:hypothetical protein